MPFDTKRKPSDHRRGCFYYKRKKLGRFCVIFGPGGDSVYEAYHSPHRLGSMLLRLYMNKIMDASAYFLYQRWFEICSLPTPFQMNRLLNALHSIFNSTRPLNALRIYEP
jgi:hypothetical protein